MKDANEFRKKWDQMVAKAWADPKFKQKLISHPTETLREFGCNLPSKVSIKIHQCPETEIHLSLPPKPTGSLSETDLKRVAAAADCCCCCVPCSC